MSCNVTMRTVGCWLLLYSCQFPGYALNLLNGWLDPCFCGLVLQRFTGYCVNMLNGWVARAGACQAVGCLSGAAVINSGTVPLSDLWVCICVQHVHPTHLAPTRPEAQIFIWVYNVCVRAYMHWQIALAISDVSQCQALAPVIGLFHTNSFSRLLTLLLYKNSCI